MVARNAEINTHLESSDRVFVSIDLSLEIFALVMEILDIAQVVMLLLELDDFFGPVIKFHL